MNSKLSSGRYVLAVQNISASAEFYKSKLGFDTIWEGDGWHFLQRGSIYIMMGECPDDKPAFETGSHSYFAYIDVTGIDELHVELQTAGMPFITAVEDKPWGQREFAIATIDGHRITFGEKISAK